MIRRLRTSPHRRGGEQTRRFRTALLGSVIVAGAVVAAGVGVADAADREGISGRGTGWRVTSPQRPDNADGYFWAGTHVMDEVGPDVQGYCMDFGNRGPLFLQNNNYGPAANPGFDANTSRMLAYISSIIDEDDADTADNRDQAVAAAYAIWGLSDLSGLGFDNDSSFGNPDWGQLWINGTIGGDVESWPADPGSNPTAISSYYEQIKTAANSLLGGAPGFNAGADVNLAPGQVTTPVTPIVTVGGQPMPLIEVRVTGVTNLAGLAVGQEFRTGPDGSVGGLVVSLINPTQPGSVTFEAVLPGGTPDFWVTDTIDGLPAQMMMTHGAQQLVPDDVQIIPPAPAAIEIATTARDLADGDNLVVRGGQLMDNVQYTGLTPGASYTANLTWMFPNGTSTGLTSSVTFTAVAADGNVDVGPVTVPFGIAGNVLVAFEQLVANPVGDVVATHEDLADTSQTITIVEATIGTTARDLAAGDNAVYGGGQIIDTIAYTNLNPGTTYTAQLVWMNKTTGQSTGLTTSVQFTPATPTGTVDVGPVTVPFNLGGTDLVAFEQVFAPGGVLVGSHEDINDVPQTVTVLQPDIGTTARDLADGDNAVYGGGQIIDTVSFENLNPGTTYTAQLVWMNKTTGQSTGLTTSVQFTPATPTGTVDVGPLTVPFNLGGTDLVAFEQVLAPDATVVATHEDINDVTQTVSVLQPDIGTTARDLADGDNAVLGGGQIIDTVSYVNLNPGTTYTAQLVWMNKTNGQSTGLTTSVQFTPATPTGTVDVGPVTVPIDLAFLGSDLVAFEQVLAPDATVVATHEDINDVTQTVTVLKPEIGTKAADVADGDHEAPVNSVVVDTVSYTNLTPGVEYQLSLVWMNRETGEATELDDSIIFTPSTPSGTIDVGPIAVPATHSNSVLVAFEELATNINGELTVVADHKDLGDDEQSVKILEPRVTTKIQGGTEMLWRSTTYDICKVEDFKGPGTCKFVGYAFTRAEWDAAPRQIDPATGRAYRQLECSDDRVIASSVSTTDFEGTGGIDEIRSKDWLVPGSAGAVVVSREFLFDRGTGLQVAEERCGMEDQTFMQRRGGDDEELPLTGIEVPQAPTSGAEATPVLVAATAFPEAAPLAQGASAEAFEANTRAAIARAETAGWDAGSEGGGNARVSLRAPTAGGTSAPSSDGSGAALWLIVAALAALAAAGGVFVKKVRRGTH